MPNSGAKPSVVFFGSGPVAADSLELLLTDFNVEAVVTKPRPAHHKGDVPVIAVAEQHNLPLHTASNKSDLTSLMADDPFKSSVGVLIDFGIIVPQTVIDYFPRGIVNSHFSVLPEWRGADPITFAVLSGQDSTGVSLMLLVQAMDEGPLITFEEFNLPTDITTPQLTKELIHLSHRLLAAKLPQYLADPDFKLLNQSATGRKMSYSRKLTKQDGHIDWHKPATVLEREIRAYQEWPASRATLAGKDVTILKATVVALSGPAGTLEVSNNNLTIYCGQDALQIELLKPAGKNEMTAASFINGHRQLLMRD